jgi:hypothetical protein
MQTAEEKLREEHQKKIEIREAFTEAGHALRRAELRLRSIGNQGGDMRANEVKAILETLQITIQRFER